MIRLPVLVALFALVSTGCTSLSIEAAPSGDPVAAARGSEAGAFPVEGEESLGWSDLTRLAREHVALGELDEAEKRLEQAAIRTQGLRPTHVARRTVFGVRARFAETLATADKIDRADVLADQLFAEAEASPGLGNAALISLARSVVERRKQAARNHANEMSPEFVPERISQTRVLSIALEAARLDHPSDDRIDLAFEVAREAYYDGHVGVARSAIDLAIADLKTLYSTESMDLASLELYRARIALEQNELALAIADATDASRIFQDSEAPPSQLGLSEAVLARALARQGDSDRAIVIARGAYTRLAADDSIDPHSRRRIVSALARVEASLGNRGQARRYYDEALDIPVQDSYADRRFVDELQIERATVMSEPAF